MVGLGHPQWEREPGLGLRVLLRFWGGHRSRREGYGIAPERDLRGKSTQYVNRA